ncbi:MAG: hypothetical protein BIFFINMI_04056 [Phycisphaerae bacterium]|nr:hypothetical protein [Phycisphaerae bacterium]
MRLATILCVGCVLTLLSGCGLVAPASPQMAAMPALPADALTAAGDSEPHPGGVEADAKIPNGPADPVYRHPTIPGGSKELVVTREGEFRHRDWAPAAATYVPCQVEHMQRWFADPYDDVTRLGPAGFGCTCDDLLAGVYCPARFMVNLVALPVSVIVKPICVPEYSGGQPRIVETDQGPRIQE